MSAAMCTPCGAVTAQRIGAACTTAGACSVIQADTDEALAGALATRLDAGIQFFGNFLHNRQALVPGVRRGDELSVANDPWWTCLSFGK